MSILLEALRKTEKNQKKQQVPTIHTEESGGAEPESLKTGPLVAMIALALVVSGWFTWRQYQVPEGLYKPPVTLADGQMHSTEAARSAEETLVETPPVTVQNQPAQAPATPISNTTSRPPRTPVESFQAGTSPGSGQANSSQNHSAGTGPSSGPNQSGATGAAGTSTASHPSTGAAAHSSQVSTRHPVKATTPVRRDTAHIPEPISYWELPDAVRASVAEIHFSVLVYNEDPAQRFVLIGGQRLAEGDEALPGLKVEEIRRDGVIFSYRLYKFLVKR